MNRLRRCFRCERDLPIAEYGTTGNSYLNDMCRECVARSDAKQFVPTPPTGSMAMHPFAVQSSLSMVRHVGYVELVRGPGVVRRDSITPKPPQSIAQHRRPAPLASSPRVQTPSPEPIRDHVAGWRRKMDSYLYEGDPPPRKVRKTKVFARVQFEHQHNFGKSSVINARPSHRHVNPFD